MKDQTMESQSVKARSVKGQCLCGKHQFSINGTVPNLYQCHCSLCRKTSGSASNTATFIKADDFSWLSATDDIQSFVKDTGFRTDFCQHCGSPVPNPLRKTDLIFVPEGLLDDLADLSVVIHIYCQSKASWDPIQTSAEQHDTMPTLSNLHEMLTGN